MDGNPLRSEKGSLQKNLHILRDFCFQILRILVFDFNWFLIWYFMIFGKVADISLQKFISGMHMRHKLTISRFSFVVFPLLAKVMYTFPGSPLQDSHLVS